MLGSKENHPSKILDISGKEFPKNNKGVVEWSGTIESERKKYGERDASYKVD